MIKPARSRIFIFLLVAFAAFVEFGCATSPAPHPAANLAAARPAVTEPSTAEAMPAVDAAVDPPAGWRQDPLRADAAHARAQWISPTGDTAYGVVVLYLPLPVGPDLVLWGFMNRMSQMDGPARILEQTPSPDLPGLRFIAEGKIYLIRVNLIVHGWRAWAIYAGSVRAKAINLPELAQAETARDRTRVDLKAHPATSR